MNTHAGYSKRTLTDTSVLLAGGGDKPLSGFIGSIQYNSTSHKITYTTAAGVAADLVTLVTTDETVKQSPQNNNVNRPLMMINGGTEASEQINTTIFSSGIYANTSTNMITARGFIKTDSNNTFVLLGGGGHKSLSDFFTTTNVFGIGNHNLAKGIDCRYNTINSGYMSTVTDSDGFRCYKVSGVTNSTGATLTPSVTLKANTWYCWSYMVKCDHATDFNYGKVGHYQVYNTASDTDVSHDDTNRTYSCSSIPANEWTWVWVRFKTIKAGSSFIYYLWYLDNYNYWFRDFKLEESYYPSRWSPCDEDYRSGLNTVINSEQLGGTAKNGLLTSFGRTSNTNNLSITVGGTSLSATLGGLAWKDSIAWSDITSGIPNIVNTFGTKTGDITLLNGQTGNGTINLTMSGNQLRATIVGLGSNAYSSTAYLKKSGDTINGDFCLQTSTNDSPDIIFLYADGREKIRIWTDDTYSTVVGPNYRVYKADGTNLYSGTLALANHTHDYVTSFGEQTGAITVRGDQATNGSVNLTMSGNQLQASIVGLGDRAFDSTSYAKLVHWHPLGNHNLVKGMDLRYVTSLGDSYHVTSSIDIDSDGFRCVRIVRSSSDYAYWSCTGATGLKANTVYVWSYYVKCSSGVSFGKYSIGHYQVYNSSSSNSDPSHEDTTLDTYPSTIPANTWTKCWIKFKTNNLKNSSFVFFCFQPPVGSTTYLRDFKLEESDIPSGWVPNDEDFRDSNGKIPWSNISSTPTSLSGYGITDGYNTYETSGSGNAITSISASGHKLTFTKGTTFSVDGHNHNSSYINSVSFSSEKLLVKKANGTIVYNDYVPYASAVPFSGVRNFMLEGNRNYVKGLDFRYVTISTTSNGWAVQTMTDSDGIKCLHIYGGSSSSGWAYSCTDSILEKNQYYTWSYKIKVKNASSFGFSSIGHYQVGPGGASHADTDRVYNVSSLSAGVWTTVTCSFKVTEANQWFAFYVWYLTSGNEYWITDFKLEKGKYYTGWCENDEGDCYRTNFYTTSDRNKKQNISSFSEHIRKFQLKDTEKYAYGVIAQEVEEMFRDGEEGNMTVNYNSILSFYIGSLENSVAGLEDAKRQLENKVKILEERIKRLESK